MEACAGSTVTKRGKGDVPAPEEGSKQAVPAVEVSGGLGCLPALFR